MWPKLANSGHLAALYRELQEARAKFNEDWSPMVHAVEQLVAIPNTDHLHAFTSHSKSIVTTCRGYGEEASHNLVSIDWSPSKRKFILELAPLEGGWALQHSPTVCSETDFEAQIREFLDALVPPSSEAEQN